jgi:hypothetical protein
MNKLDYIGANELIYNTDNENGIYSGGFSVNSVMMKAGMSPIMTLNTSQKGGTNKVSDLFNDLVIPNWVLSYNDKMVGGEYKENNEKSLVAEYQKQRFVHPQVFKMYNNTLVKKINSNIFYKIGIRLFSEDYLKEFIKLNEQNINIVWQLAFNTHFFKNESPGIFSIFDHDYRIRILALEEAKRTLNFIENKTDIKFKRNIKWNVNFFNGVINTLEKSLTEDNKLISSPTSKIFLQWLEENEKLMPPKKNFEELWPELYHIMINN